jgi:hypothetical protein
VFEIHFIERDYKYVAGFPSTSHQHHLGHIEEEMILLSKAGIWIEIADQTQATAL